MTLDIRKKIAAGFITIGILLLVAGLVGYYSLTKLSDSIDFITGPAWNTADGTMEGYIGVEAQMLAFSHLVAGVYDERDALTEARSHLKEAIEFTAQSLGRMRDSGLMDAEHIRELDRKLAHFESARDAVFKAYEFENKTISPSLMRNYSLASEELLQFLEEFENTGDSKIEAEEANIEATKKSAFSLFILTIMIGLGLSVIMYLYGANSIVRPLQEVSRHLGDIAQGEGDLTVALNDKREDEIGILAKEFNAFVRKLRETMKQVAGATDRLGNVMQGMSVMVSDTKRNMEAQDSETTQLASGLQQLSITFQDVANNVGRVAEAASNANEEATQSQQVVSGAVSASDALAHEVEKAAGVVTQLKKESENIGAVLDVIRGIAEQTNLLALNAAIEAARAGEQGRGFAVVADEVRALAGRTQQSTQEIQQMIQRLQTGTEQAFQVMEGGRLKAQATMERAAQAISSLETIVKAVTTIADMTTQIASATEESQAMAEEASRNLLNIKEVSSTTTKNSQKAAEAVIETNELTGRLSKLVGQFKVS